MDKEQSATTVQDAVSGYLIKGRYKRQVDKLDTAKDLKEAEYLVGEYEVAFGPSWKIWFEKEKP